MNRRQFLRGSGSIAIALPFLASLRGRVSAAPTPRPRHFIAWFTSSGTIRSAWTPTGSETAFTFGPILKPLDPFKSQLLVLDGVDMISTQNGPGGAHQKGIGHLLTGTELQDGPFASDGGGSAGFANGPSIDQAIAQRIGGATRLPSIELAVQSFNNDVSGRMSYSAPGVSQPPSNDPVEAFNRIFSGMTGGDTAAMERLRLERKSVLDGVTAQLSSLSPKLGGDDRVRLEKHLEAVRDVEKRLGAVASSTCSVPAKPGAIDIKAPGSFPIIGKLHTDLMVLALSCDITRVASLQWSRAVSPTVYTWLGADMKESHHGLSHAGDSDTVAKDKLTRINVWHAQNFAYLLDSLQKIETIPGQSLLDETVVFWGNELSVGNSHSRNDMPFIVAGGGAGGAMKLGRYLKYSGGTPHNNLLVSLANAVGLTDVKTFGNPKYCTGPLARFAG